MMRFLKSHINARPLPFEGRLDYREFPFKNCYPLLGIDGGEARGELYKEKDRIFASIEGKATIVLEDSYTARPFRKEVSFLESAIEIMEQEDGEGEGFIMPGREISIEDLVFLMIRSELPLKVLDEGSSLPPSGDGYNVLNEDEVGEVEEERSSPFDVLKDLDLD